MNSRPWDPFQQRLKGWPISRFPVKSRGFPKLHAPFLNERRARGCVQGCVQEIRGISLVFREMWDTRTSSLRGRSLFTTSRLPSRIAVEYPDASLRIWGLLWFSSASFRLSSCFRILFSSHNNSSPNRTWTAQPCRARVRRRPTVLSALRQVLVPEEHRYYALGLPSTETQ
jgi:hypothetical protein